MWSIITARISRYDVAEVAKLEWDITHQNDASQEGIAISFELASFQEPYHAQNSNNRQKAIERLAEILKRHQITWLIPSPTNWTINLDELESFFSSEIPALNDLEWFNGVISVSPDDHLEKRKTGHGDEYVQWAILKITKELTQSLFTKSVQDPKLAQIMASRWKESQQAFDCGAYLATIILLGSILEGILFDKAQNEPSRAMAAQAAPKNREGKVGPISNWSLENLINVANECGWISRGSKEFSKALQGYRNLIHPREQLKKDITVGLSECKTARMLIEAILEEWAS